MQAFLAELLENLEPGLPWARRDGLVRHANADAVARTGLAGGRIGLWPLLQAVRGAREPVALQRQAKVRLRPQGETRDLTGFKSCQHIVPLHGGPLGEEEEDGLHHFLVRLPTGAASRDDDARLDIAQAQRYACDMAAPVARARNPKH